MKRTVRCCLMVALAMMLVGCGRIRYEHQWVDANGCPHYERLDVPYIKVPLLDTTAGIKTGSGFESRVHTEADAQLETLKAGAAAAVAIYAAQGAGGGL